MAGRSERGREILFWGAMVVLSALLSSWPLLSSHVLFGNDALFHLARIEGIREGLEGGQFPVRMYGYFFGGYGYPAGLLYPDLFLYIPALLRMAGCSLHAACHLFYFFINLLTALIAWWSFTKLAEAAKEGSLLASWAVPAGAAAAMLYTGFLYRLADLYSRCALGEVLAMAFLPMALASFWLMLHRSPAYWPGVAAGCTGVLQSHILSSLMMIAAIILLLMLSLPSLLRRETLQAALKAAGAILVLNLWFYAPFCDAYFGYNFHMKSAVQGAHQLAANAYGWDAIGTMWGFCGMPLIFLLLGIFASAWHWLHDGTAQGWGREFWVLLFFGLFTLWAMSESFPWEMLENLPLLGKGVGVLQFPFRLLLLGSTALSFCAGAALVRLAHGRCHFRLVVAFCCMLATASNLSLLSREGLVLPYSHSLPVPVTWSICYEDSRLCDVFPLLERDPAYADMRTSELHLIENGVIGWLYPDYLPAEISEKELMEDVPFDVPGLFRLSAGELYRISPADIRPASAVEHFSRAGTSLRFEARMGKPAEILLPLFFHPGYEARAADGRELPLSKGEAGRMQVLVPAGETEVAVRYGGKPWWNAALLFSLAGWAAFLLWAGRCIRKTCWADWKNLFQPEGRKTGQRCGK